MLPLLCFLGMHKDWEWGSDGMIECRVYRSTCYRCGRP